MAASRQSAGPTTASCACNSHSDPTGRRCCACHRRVAARQRARPSWRPSGGAHATSLVSPKTTSAGAADASLPAALPPLVSALLPRMLLRVALSFAGKGCAHAPAAVYAARPQDEQSWRASGRDGWGGTALPKGAHAAVPAGELLGFVTSGGYNRLLGTSTAIAFVAAAPFAQLMRDGGAQSRRQRAPRPRAKHVEPPVSPGARGRAGVTRGACAAREQPSTRPLSCDHPPLRTAPSRCASCASTRAAFVRSRASDS
jgi:hypothetical protein